MNTGVAFASAGICVDGKLGPGLWHGGWQAGAGLRLTENVLVAVSGGRAQGPKVQTFCRSPYVGAGALTCTNGKRILTDCTLLGLVKRAVKILRIFLFFFHNI